MTSIVRRTPVLNSLSSINAVNVRISSLLSYTRRINLSTVCTNFVALSNTFNTQSTQLSTLGRTYSTTLSNYWNISTLFTSISTNTNIRQLVSSLSSVTNLYFGASTITSSFNVSRFVNIGTNNTLTGIFTGAVGNTNTITNNFNLVVGTSNRVTSSGSVAIGLSNNISGAYSHATGISSVIRGFASHADGGYHIIDGQASHAEGQYAYISTLAIGAHAEGFSNYIEQNTRGTHAEGSNTNVLSTGGHAEGVNTTSFGFASHAEGLNTIAYGYASHAEGSSTMAFSTACHAEGFVTLAEGEYSHAEGHLPIASGFASHAEGFRTLAEGDYSHAEGWDTSSFGIVSHVEGRDCRAIGNYSHCEGRGSRSLGVVSHAEGRFTSSFGDYSHAEGHVTLSLGVASHAEGMRTNSIGIASHSEGSNTIAEGAYSHAEGFNTIARGDASHVQGSNLGSLQANGNYSHVHGTNVIVTGRAATAHLYGLPGSTVTVSGDYAFCGGNTCSANGYLSFVYGTSNRVDTNYPNMVILGGENNRTSSIGVLGISSATQRFVYPGRGSVVLGGRTTQPINNWSLAYATENLDSEPLSAQTENFHLYCTTSTTNTFCNLVYLSNSASTTNATSSNIPAYVANGKYYINTFNITLTGYERELPSTSVGNGFYSGTYQFNCFWGNNSTHITTLPTTRFRTWTLLTNNGSTITNNQSTILNPIMSLNKLINTPTIRLSAYVSTSLYSTNVNMQSITALSVQSSRDRPINWYAQVQQGITYNTN